MATDLPLQRQLPPAQPLLADILLALQGGTSTALGKSADSAPPDMVAAPTSRGMTSSIPCRGLPWLAAAIRPLLRTDNSTVWAHPSSAEHQSLGLFRLVVKTSQVAPHLQNG